MSRTKRPIRSRRDPLASAVLLAISLPSYSPSVAADPFPAIIDLALLNGSDGFKLNGAIANERSGAAVSGVGDFNGDGIRDLIIGAPNVFADPGKGYVVFGQVGVGAGGRLSLSSLDGANGFVINGSQTEFNYLGIAVSSAGDINGDGIDDLLIGASRSYASAGRTYVVFGGAGVGASGSVDLTSLSGTNGFVIIGIATNDSSGRSVSGVGDVNGDGIDDLLIGAPFAAGYGYQFAGQSYVVFGAVGVGAGGSLNLSSLDGDNGFVLDGLYQYDTSGFSVSGAGDINGDGIDDLIVGAPQGDPFGPNDPFDYYWAGVTYVVLGGVGLGANGHLRLSPAAPNGAHAFVLEGIAGYDRSGQSVSGAGDFNDDGIDDLIIGAPSAEPGGLSDSGQSYIVFGAPDVGVGAHTFFRLADLNGTNGFVLNGVHADDDSGRAVSGAGDVNGDGINDVIVAAPEAAPNGYDKAGATYVVFGGDGVGASGSLNLSSLDGTNGFLLNGAYEGDSSGSSVSDLGDVNGDGIDDLIVGAPNASPGGHLQAGVSYVVFGRASDSDADGVTDDADNCILVANVDQRDTDSDGIGNACDPDLNNDCVVNFVDLGSLKSVFFSNDPDADLNGDGSVNFVDLGTMKSFFFQPPGPSGRSNICDQNRPGSGR